MNFVILAAILIQGFVAKASKVAGAVIGFLITTGILIWGLVIYGGGGTMMFFGFEVSQPFFIIICIVWYGFDVASLLGALSESKSVQQATIENPPSDSYD